LEHLIGVLAKRGAPPLAPGEIITTGVMTDAHPVATGERWSTQLSGAALAGLTLEFT
jgi:2-oxo-3-hexenedioate decarboxylase